jgi:hypothetical protein
LITNVRRYIADTFAMVVFSTACGAFLEIVVAGFSVRQSIGVRLSAIPLILFAGRPYGLYRDWLFRRFRASGHRSLRSLVLDALANTSYQAALYVGILAVNGVEPPKMLKALLSVIAVGFVSGRPYGLFLVQVRKLFGIPTES